MPSTEPAVSSSPEVAAWGVRSPWGWRRPAPAWPSPTSARRRRPPPRATTSSASACRAAAIHGDVRTAEGAARLVDEAAAALSGLDAVVFAASGPFLPQPPHEIDPATWSASLEVVAGGFFFCASRRVPPLRRRRAAAA